MVRIPVSWLCRGWLVAALAAPAHTDTQSDALSRQSQASVGASVEVPAAVAMALSEGARFSVQGVEVSSNAATVMLAAASTGASFVVHVSAETARRLGIAAGTAVSVTVVAGGWILSAAGEALCFVPHARVRPHIHSRRIDA